MNHIIHYANKIRVIYVEIMFEIFMQSLHCKCGEHNRNTFLPFLHSKIILFYEELTQRFMLLSFNVACFEHSLLYFNTKISYITICKNIAKITFSIRKSKMIKSKFKLYEIYVPARYIFVINNLFCCMKYLT